ARHAHLTVEPALCEQIEQNVPFRIGEDDRLEHRIALAPPVADASREPNQIRFADRIVRRCGDADPLGIHEARPSTVGGSSVNSERSIGRSGMPWARRSISMTSE